MLRIAIFWNYLFYYRIPFYQKIGNLPGVSLTVFHGGNPDRDIEDLKSSSTNRSFKEIEIKTKEVSLMRAVLYFQTGMWRHLIKGKYDVIVCEGNFGILTNIFIALYAKIMNIRFYYWAAGWERGRIRGIPSLLRKLYIRMTAPFADGYMCYGSNAVDFLSKYGVDRSKCTIIQNTVDTDKIANNLKRFRDICDKKKEELQIGDKRVILSVGRLIERKNFNLLLKSYSSLKNKMEDICLLIIGDGPERNNLIKIINQNRVKDVFLLGQIVEEVGLYFMLSDIFVLPGAGGLAINEAMAYGLPVICSEADGTEKDLIVDGLNGFFFKKGDSHDLAKKISLIFSSEEFLNEMGKEAYNHIYTKASMPLMVERFYNMLFSNFK